LGYRDFKGMYWMNSAHGNFRYSLRPLQSDSGIIRMREVAMEAS